MGEITVPGCRGGRPILKRNRPAPFCSLHMLPAVQEQIRNCTGTCASEIKGLQRLCIYSPITGLIKKRRIASALAPTAPSAAPYGRISTLPA